MLFNVGPRYEDPFFFFLGPEPGPTNPSFLSPRCEGHVLYRWSGRNWLVIANDCLTPGIPADQIDGKEEIFKKDRMR